MGDDLATRIARSLGSTAEVEAPPHRLWLVGTGPYHDAAELGTFAFAGSGRSAAAVAGDGHTRLGELLGPQDACVLVGGDAELTAYARRVAGGAGATVTELAVAVTDEDRATERFVLAGAGVLALCRRLGAPGVTEADLAALPTALEAAAVAGGVDPIGPGRRVIAIGSGPAAVTARHLAVAVRAADPQAVIEGLDAQDVPGVAAGHLEPGTTVVALDVDRDPDAPVVRVARMAEAEGAAVRRIAGDPDLGAVAAQLPLALSLTGHLDRH